MTVYVGSTSETPMLQAERVAVVSKEAGGKNRERRLKVQGGGAWSGPPPGLKQKDLVGIPWRVAFALQADGWYLRQDNIWCLSPSTIVYAKTATTEGPATIHDLVRLEPSTVRLWTGQKWSRVTHWHPSEAERPLRLWLRSGERISCTSDHEWPLSDGRVVRADQLNVGDVLATTTLPDSESGADMPEDLAWFSGLFLAEGSFSDDAIQISGHVKETLRHDRLQRIAEKYGGTFVNRHHGKAASVVVHGDVLHGAIRHFIKGERAHGKHIHPRVWRLPTRVLRAFLDGYLAGDGHFDAINNRWRLGFCANHAWANDLRTLAARIGATLTLKATYAKIGKTREFESYRGELRWDTRSHHNSKARSEIIKIGPASRGTYYDIGIEDDPHLFALSSGVLTHNSKPNPMPESVQDRCTRSHEYVFLLAKNRNYYYDGEAIREPASPASIARLSQKSIDSQTGSNRVPGKTNGNMKAVGRPLRGRGHVREHSGFHSKWDGLSKDEQQAWGANKKSVWTVATLPYKEAHFATYPPKLIEPCILAGSRPGDTVLDPFGGSGTTAAVALEHGRDAILCELNPDYVDLIPDRINSITDALVQGRLFEGVG